MFWDDSFFPLAEVIVFFPVCDEDTIGCKALSLICKSSKSCHVMSVANVFSFCEQKNVFCFNDESLFVKGGRVLRGIYYCKAANLGNENSRSESMCSGTQRNGKVLFVAVYYSPRSNFDFRQD
jgi:hypothetical protein